MIDTVRLKSINKKLSMRVFILSQLAILVLGLTFILTLNKVLNQPNQSLNTLTHGPITSEPKSLFLEVMEPEDNWLSFNSQILISGKTLSNTSVLISSKDQDMVFESKKDGSFSASFPLTLGVNEIAIVVFSDKGESKEIKRLVFYSKEKI